MIASHAPHHVLMGAIDEITHPATMRSNVVSCPPHHMATWQAREVHLTIGRAFKAASEIMARAMATDTRISAGTRKYARNSVLGTPGVPTNLPQIDFSDSGKIQGPPPDSGRVIGTFVATYLGTVAVREKVGQEVVEASVPILAEQRLDSNGVTVCSKVKNTDVVIVVSGEQIKVTDQITSQTTCTVGKTNGFRAFNAHAVFSGARVSGGYQIVGAVAVACRWWWSFVCIEVPSVTLAVLRVAQSLTGWEDPVCDW
jgi:hypothetical protein